MKRVKKPYIKNRKLFLDGRNKAQEGARKKTQEVGPPLNDTCCESITNYYIAYIGACGNAYGKRLKKKRRKYHRRKYRIRKKILITMSTKR